MINTFQIGFRTKFYIRQPFNVVSKLWRMKSFDQDHCLIYLHDRCQDLQDSSTNELFDYLTDATRYDRLVPPPSLEPIYIKVSLDVSVLSGLTARIDVTHLIS